MISDVPGTEQPAVLYEKRDRTAWVTLNRPEAKNMMDAEVFAGIVDAWDEARRDRDVRAVVLTGAGDVDFCAGGDLSRLIPLWTGARQPGDDLERRVADPRILDAVMLKSDPLDKPISAAANGRAPGGGTEVLLLTDIRIAAEHAVFGLPEPRYGVVPGAGAMVRLARQIPGQKQLGLEPEVVLANGEPDMVLEPAAELVLQAEVDVSGEVAAATEVKEVRGSHDGPAVVVGCAVVHVQGEPFAVALLDTPDGARALARSDDTATVRALQTEECCGRVVAVSAGRFRFV